MTSGSYVLPRVVVRTCHPTRARCHALPMVRTCWALRAVDHEVLGPSELMPVIDRSPLRARWPAWRQTRGLAAPLATLASPNPALPSRRLP